MVWQLWPHMKAAKRVSDCLPLPPTPTSIAEPRGAVRMRARRQTWSMASGKKTSGIGPTEAVYSSK